MRSIVVAYTASGDGFENVVHLSFMEPTENVETVPADDSKAKADKYLKDYTAELENLSEAEVFVLNEVNNGEYVKYYDGSGQIEIKAETKNGKFHSDFIEYYENRTVRSEGNYRKGRKTARWKYYDEQGELTEKSWQGV